jgi:hypothetical protein
MGHPHPEALRNGFGLGQGVSCGPPEVEASERPGEGATRQEIRTEVVHVEARVLGVSKGVVEALSHGEHLTFPPVEAESCGHDDLMGLPEPLERPFEIGQEVPGEPKGADRILGHVGHPCKLNMHIY